MVVKAIRSPRLKIWHYSFREIERERERERDTEREIYIYKKRERKRETERKRERGTEKELKEWECGNETKTGILWQSNINDWEISL